MPRHSFFVNPGSIQGSRVELSNDIAHQIKNVLRLKPGDSIDLRDGSGYSYEAHLVELFRDRAVAEVLERRQLATEPRVKLALYQALLKGQKMELVLQKGTEIGVSRFVPVLSERCVSRPSTRELEGKSRRWREIVREAAEQAGRAILPAVDSPLSFRDALTEAASNPVRLMAWEEERAHGLGAALRDARSTPAGGDAPKEVALLIGPEGGFSETEALMAHRAGVATVSLGPRTLRAETAALVAATLVFCETGDLDG